MRGLTGIFIGTFLLFGTLAAQTDSVYYGNTSSKQREEKKVRDNKWKEKFGYGGNFQTLFGSYTYIYLSPTIAYSPVKRLQFGIGAIYNYSNWDQGRYGRLIQTVYGGHSFMRFHVVPNFFLQAQYDKLLQPDRYNFNRPGSKVWVDYMMAGLGFSQPVTNKLAVSTSLMYNITPHRLSIYPIPLIFQVGFNAKF